MATRSTIALEFADGSVGQVYCHWDGYLEHNGQLLSDHYRDPFKLRELIDLGDLSSLSPDIGAKHQFENPHPYKSTEWQVWHDAHKNQCTFYGRDRGEPGIEARYFKNFDEYVREHQYEEYEYILRRDGRWYVCHQYDNRGFIPLEPELKVEAVA